MKLYILSNKHLLNLYLPFALLLLIAQNFISLNSEPLNTLNNNLSTAYISKGLAEFQINDNYPVIPKDPKKISLLIDFIEKSLRDKDTSPKLIPLLAHYQQITYRYLSRESIKAKQVMSFLPKRWKHIYSLHLSARAELLSLSLGKNYPTHIPAWQIIPPEPSINLISYYKKAQLQTGIDWEILAAINLIETGMGRIRGASVANAQGPMQFLPSTWALKGIGNNGDIYDPEDSILAAARYLVMRGGLTDIKDGLWGYNNNYSYGRAVLIYAQLLKVDPLSFNGLYHWKIHYRSKEGDLWLPVGFRTDQPLPISIFIKQFPSSVPPF